VPVHPAVAEKLAGESLGNPLALKELARALAPEQLRGREPLPNPLPLAADLRQLFLDRLRRLPARTRRALLVVAASSGESTEIATTLNALDLDVRDLGSAETAGILAAGSEIRFEHPLVRAAVYHEAKRATHRAAHLALADAAHEAGHPARRAWHLADAAVGRDEAVATALEEAAADAIARGAHEVAASTLQRAAKLSSVSEKAVDRTFAAAGEYVLAGQPERALALLDPLHEAAPDALSRARINHLRGRVLMSKGPLLPAQQILAESAYAIKNDRPAHAAAMLSDAALACFMGGSMSLGESFVREAFELSGERDDEPGEITHLLFTGMLVMRGLALEAREHVERERRRFADLQAAHEWQPLVLASIWLMWAEEHALAEAILGGTIAESRALSSPALLPLALAQHAELLWRRGDWARSYSYGTESVALARDTGQVVILSYGLACAALVLAGMGRDAECRDAAQTAMDEGRAVGSESTMSRAHAALGLLELGAGRPGEAVEHLRRAQSYLRSQQVGEPTVVPFAGDLIEALLRVDRMAEAEHELEVLAAHADSSGRLWTLGVVARIRGLLAQDGPYEHHFVEAMRLFEQLGAVFELARTALAYGERLRRNGQRLRAREQLRRSLDEFDRLGAGGWSAKARSELRASGETIGRRRTTGINELTPQELHVAHAVASGSTNREVAASLFLSPKTIEFHLGNIYSKLGIRSRTELVQLVGVVSGSAVA
jgi:DNA-binding CsgD family transcriptional regulator